MKNGLDLSEVQAILTRVKDILKINSYDAFAPDCNGNNRLVIHFNLDELIAAQVLYIDKVIVRFKKPNEIVLKELKKIYIKIGDKKK